MNSLRIVHCSGHFHSLGGSQAVLRRHLAHDQTHGIPSRFLVMCEPAPLTQPNVHTLGVNGFHSLREIRRRLARCSDQTAGALVVSHDCWGLPFLADLDHAARRIGYLHNNPPGFENVLRHQAGLLDGFICVSEHQTAAVRESLPELGPERIRVLPLPIPAPSAPPRRPPMANRPVVIGYSGRLARVQKRVERLVDLVAALKSFGVAFRLEILGDGPMQPWLQQHLGADSRVVFRQKQSGDRYWQLLSEWDFIVFVSDWEGLPNALLEAMQCGVLPLYPRIGTGGDAYTAEILPDLLYTSKDFRQAAAAIRKIQDLSEPEVEALRERCRQRIRPHQPDNYFSAFYDLVHRIAVSPRLSQSQFAPRPAYLTDFCLLGILTRFHPAALLKRTPRSATS